MADPDLIAKHEQWLKSRKARCAYGICGNKPVVEFNGERYCRRCVRYARARSERIAYADDLQRKLDSQPALLAACEELLAWPTGEGPKRCATRDQAYEQARAAIKAARGEV